MLIDDYLAKRGYRPAIVKEVVDTFDLGNKDPDELVRYQWSETLEERWWHWKRAQARIYLLSDRHVAIGFWSEDTGCKGMEWTIWRRPDSDAELLQAVKETAEEIHGPYIMFGD